MELLNKADEVMSRMITGINNVEASFSEIIQSHSVMTSSTHKLTGDLHAMNETSETLRSLETDIISSLETISRLIASLDDAGNKAKSGCGPSLNMFSRSGRASQAGQQVSA